MLCAHPRHITTDMWGHHLRMQIVDFNERTSLHKYVSYSVLVSDIETFMIQDTTRWLYCKNRLRTREIYRNIIYQVQSIHIVVAFIDIPVRQVDLECSLW